MDANLKKMGTRRTRMLTIKTRGEEFGTGYEEIELGNFDTHSSY